MKPIYEPKGAAREYGELAINIYTGCPHRCYYCFSPSVLKKDKDAFHTAVQPREGLLEALESQIVQEHIKDRTIHLCFSCDPYPKGCDSSTTREVIRMLKEYGNHVQILTKNGEDAMRDFDLLDDKDWFGVTYAGYEPRTWDDGYIPESEPGSGAPFYRIRALHEAHKRGIRTWCSCEPVLDAASVINFIQSADYVDLWKIGKLNYHASDINWADFGKQVELVCIAERRNYCIKDSLRKEMQKDETRN